MVLRNSGRVGSRRFFIKKGYLSQTANLFVNLKSNTMKNTLQSYSIPGIIQYFFWKSVVW